MFRRIWLFSFCASLAVLKWLPGPVSAQQPPAPPRFDSPMVAPAPPPQQPFYGPTGGMQNAYPANGRPVPTNGGPVYSVANLPAGPPATAYVPQDQTHRFPPTGDETSGYRDTSPNRTASSLRGPPASAAAPPGQPSVAVAHTSVPPAIKIFEPGQIIAWVGDQPIQVGEVMPTVEQSLAPILEKMTPEQRESQAKMIQGQGEKLLRAALDRAIEVKLLYLDFLRTLPADKLKEALPQITERAEEQFYEKQLPDALEKAGANSAGELDKMLRGYGSSLQEQKRAFVERILGQSVLGQKIDFKPEITHQVMLDYYHEQADDYYLPAKARWEKLTVKFDRFGSKTEAWAAIGRMGNEVLRGASLATVARRGSQGIEAANGGQHDWTTKDSLASTVLDEAIFSLPIGKLSQRLEDEKGFHIVRVIERQGDGKVPFLEAQVEIKERLRKKRVREQVTDYVEKLKESIPVWTVFNNETATALR